MLVDQQFLRIPGPTPIPPSVQRTLIQPMIGHRDQDTSELINRLQPKLQSIFGTEQHIAIIAGSGTAGLEACVVNSVQPNDEVLVIVTGAFGERFSKICNTYQLHTHRLDVPWGTAVSPHQVTSYLQQHPGIKAVFATHCETSTGVLNPIRELAATIHQNSNALFIVDAVSSLGAVEVNMDQWGVDMMVTGSQKALMLPPGLTFIAVSDKAWDVINRSNQPRFYLDLRKYHDYSKIDSTPFTPSLSLLYGLEKSLDLIHQEGLQQVYARHKLMKNMTRSAIQHLHIPLLTNDADASPTVTAIQPLDIKSDNLRKVLKEQFQLVLAGGQGQLKGAIFRIGHMGYCSPADILQTISAMEIGLVKLGSSIPLGEGTKAAQLVYLEGGRNE